MLLRAPSRALATGLGLTVSAGLAFAASRWPYSGGYYSSSVEPVRTYAFWAWPALADADARTHALLLTVGLMPFGYIVGRRVDALSVTGSLAALVALTAALQASQVYSTPRAAAALYEAALLSTGGAAALWVGRAGGRRALRVRR